MNQVQIVERFGDARHAGPKAQRDVASILSMHGWVPLPVRRITTMNPALRNVGRFIWVLASWFYRKRLPQGGVVLLQYPGVSFANKATFFLLNEQDKKRRKYKLIVLVHDLHGFRAGTGSLCDNELRLFNLADCIILHNEFMIEAVSGCGIPREKLVPLECFDYLANCPEEIARKPEPLINVAGNLSVARSGWMRGVGALKGLKWKMFGTSYEPCAYGEGAFSYEGCLSPEILPAKLSDGYGLIWYSDSPDAVQGEIVDYIRIINPHKLSLYLRAGLPVIVWSKAAVAPFVLKHGVGIVVDNLAEIPERIRGIDSLQYAAMAAAAVRLGKSLAHGEFTSRAVSCAVEIIKESR